MRDIRFRDFIMTFVCMLVGAVVGVYFASPFGNIGLVVTGAVVGLLFAQVRVLRRRVEGLERRLAPAAPITTSRPRAVAAPATRAPIEPVIALAPTVRVAPPAPRDADLRREARTTGIGRWFTQGNVPVKVGVLVLFLGVAALLKYAADQGWLRMPIEFRLAGVAVAAIGALVFAWRRRASHRPFALALQGGAIGVLILTVFAAYRLYGLLPSALAFALLVVVVAGGATLAVLQDAVALAVLAIAGGFLAPILTSTGDGSHVVLFTYYAVLNAAIFGIAWVRSWRALNLLGFAFTFAIGIAWGVTRYRPELFASTEPFLVLFFGFYLLLPVLHARRQDPDRRDVVDGTLLFGTPLVAFALQAGLLDGARLPLAASALAVAAVYAMLATLASRRGSFALLGRSHAVLALGFATLAVPLALSARATASTWALEGAALVWLGLAQKRRLPQAIGGVLQLAAAAAFAWSVGDRVTTDAFVDGACVNAALIALAGLITARLLNATPRRDVAHAFFAWGWAWTWMACGIEILHVAPAAQVANLSLVVLAATAIVAGIGLRRLGWEDCAWPVLAMFPLAVGVVAWSTFDLGGLVDHGPLEHEAAAAWGFWLVCALRSLVVLRGRPGVGIAHAILLGLAALVPGAEAAHLMEHHLRLGFVWQACGALVPAAALFALVLARHRLVRWPLGDAADAWRRTLLDLFAGVLGTAALAGLFAVGDPAPLPYVPLLNPLELGQVAYLMSLLTLFGRAARNGNAVIDAEWRARGLALAGFAMLTATTLRGVHFLGGVPWSGALWDSSLAQAALTITWTLAGIVAMLLGQRRGSRAVWFGGAVLMAVVVAKLAVVDRRFLHDLQAIVGVLVVGLLLVAVGYVAPAPPRPASRSVAA